MSRGRRPRGDDSDSGIGCLLVLTLILAVMPFVGLYLLLNKRSTDEDRAMGGVLLIVGIVIWVMWAYKASHG